MKFLGIVAAASLAFAPVVASADAGSSTTYDRPAPGPVASSSHDEEIDRTAAILVGIFGLGGLAALIALSGDGQDDTTTTTTTTTTTE